MNQPNHPEAKDTASLNRKVSSITKDCDFSQLRLQTENNNNSRARAIAPEMEMNTQQDTPLDEMVLASQPDEVKRTAPWARLVTKGPDVITYELDTLDPDEQGRHNLVVLGRGSACGIRFDLSPRVSNKHCTIYCKMNRADPTNPYLEAWIEDSSANGTFLKQSGRLQKNVPRLLRNGDEVSLINPELVRLAGANVTAVDVQRNSFSVLLDLPNPTARNNIASTRSQTMLRNLQNGLVRANTVIRLLDQQRNIQDFYEMRELLGTGAAGQVYRGIKKDNGTEWAIKIIDIRAMGDQDASTVTKEAAMLRSIRHANIIHFEDIFSAGHNIFLVMELSKGGDLFERISSKKRYTEFEAKQVMRQLLDAMAFLHERKIAHRDLKPENILLPYRDHDTFIKITDFGLAKVLDDNGAKTYCGTPQYFAPEVLDRKYTVAGAGRYSVEADIWSCGCILYVLLLGAFPFHGATDKIMFTMIRNGKYSQRGPQWAAISPEAKDLLNKLLHVNPAQRITASLALHHPWLAEVMHMDIVGNVVSAQNSGHHGVSVPAVVKAAVPLFDAPPPPAAAPATNGHTTAAAAAGSSSSKAAAVNGSDAETPTKSTKGRRVASKSAKSPATATTPLTGKRKRSTSSSAMDVVDEEDEGGLMVEDEKAEEVEHKADDVLRQSPRGRGRPAKRQVTGNGPTSASKARK